MIVGVPSSVSDMSTGAVIRVFSSVCCLILVIMAVEARPPSQKKLGFLDRQAFAKPHQLRTMCDTLCT